MRAHIASLLVAALFVLAPGCGDDNADPIGDACNKACELAQTSPCYNAKNPQDRLWREVCLADCKKLGGEAEKSDKYIAGCGTCVAETFFYSVKTDPPCSATSTDPTCCFGSLHKAPESPECGKRCLEPDGGVGY